MSSEGEEPDYESDPSESLVPLEMRRRQASDDEDDGAEDCEEAPRHARKIVMDTDEESDGQGGAQVYEEDESDFEEEEQEQEIGEAEVNTVGSELGLDGRGTGDDRCMDQNHNQSPEEAGKKQNEPFSVPKAGAFYMHDDRLRENGNGQLRRIRGGHKLWGSIDDRAWVHDRFEEMNFQDTHYNEEQRKTHKGHHFRGRGEKRDPARVYVRRNRSGGYGENDNQTCRSKGVRGKGPRRYEPLSEHNNRRPSSQNKRTGRGPEVTSKIDSETSVNISNAPTEVVPPQKQVFASSLNSASPPFYPSGDITVTQKTDLQNLNTKKKLSSSAHVENLSSTSFSNALMCGKTVIDPVSHNKIDAGHSFQSGSEKSLAHFQHVNTTQYPQTKVQEGGNLTISGPSTYQATSSFNQVNRVSLPAVLQKASQNFAELSSQASSQQLVQRPGNTTSPFQGPSTTLSKVTDMEVPPGSSKSKTALDGKGKDSSAQGVGRGSFLYSGAQVIGAAGAKGVVQGGQNFPGTPALLPVMQFGGQHHGGLGVPAVGMALPGYVAKPQLGYGNSEMTWMPLLAGAAAGALGVRYCSPYIAVDGGYYTHSSGQPSSMSVSNKGSTINKPSIDTWKSPERSELLNDEFGQRQNKPRRYSEMNFGQ